MTLAPLDSSTVRGVAGKPGPLSFFCVTPGCSSPAQQRHHFWPKSYLRGQPYEWVQVGDGDVIQNSGGLCVYHHANVTGGIGGHAAHIRWNETRQDLEWWTAPWPGTQEWVFVGTLKTDSAPLPSASEAAVERLKEDLCPTCGKPRHKAEPKPRRKVKSWNVTVPDDEEDGADVLDALVEDFATILGYSGYPSRLRRYHTLSKVLAWSSIHRGQFIEDWVEASQ